MYTFEQGRLQTPFLLMYGGFTATRPQGLISTLYRDVQLMLVRGKDGLPVLAIKLCLENIKSSTGETRAYIKSIMLNKLHTNYNRMRFTLFESAELSLYPLIYFLAFEFADDTFEADISSPEQIYKLIIPAQKNKLEIRWKKEW